MSLRNTELVSSSISDGPDGGQAPFWGRFSQHPWRMCYNHATGPQKTAGEGQQQCVCCGNQAASEKGQLAKQLCRGH